MHGLSPCKGITESNCKLIQNSLIILGWNWAINVSLGIRKLGRNLTKQKEGIIKLFFILSIHKLHSKLTLRAFKIRASLTLIGNSLLNHQLENLILIYSHMIKVPAPIKDAASFQKSFFQPSTMMHFARFCLFLLHGIAQNFSKKHLFLVII